MSWPIHYMPGPTGPSDQPPDDGKLHMPAEPSMEPFEFADMIATEFGRAFNAPLGEFRKRMKDIENLVYDQLESIRQEDGPDL